MFEEGRGRPRGRSALNHAYFESVVLIASKHDLDPKTLVDAFFEAWENGTSRCGGLKISCREANQDRAIFLLTKGEKVVWQFPVSLDGIRNSEARDYIKNIQLPDEVKKSFAAWAGCVAGALEKSQYINTIKRAGFKKVEIVSQSTNEIELSEELKGRVTSVQVEAYKI